MTYEKPELNTLGNAGKLIESLNSKVDSPAEPIAGNPPAYDLDE